MDDATIAAAFDTFDRDKSGSIDSTEVKELLRKVYKRKGVSVTEKQLDEQAKVNKYTYHIVKTLSFVIQLILSKFIAVVFRIFLI